MNVKVNHVRMVEHVMMRLIVTHVNVWMDSLVLNVKQVKIAIFILQNVYQEFDNDNKNDNNKNRNNENNNKNRNNKNNNNNIYYINNNNNDNYDDNNNNDKNDNNNNDYINKKKIVTLLYIILSST